MSISTEADLELLVGDMEAVPCEHSEHGKRTDIHSDEPASHYIRSGCRGCTPDKVYPACPAFVEAIRLTPQIRCKGCGRDHLTADLFTILGPVGGRK